MKVLRFIWKWWRGLWRPGAGVSSDIDTHKWESKIEMRNRLSDKRH